MHLKKKKKPETQESLECLFYINNIGLMSTDFLNLKMCEDMA